MRIEREGIPLRPGVEEIFDYLDEIDVPRAVATSTHRELASIKLGTVGLLHRIRGLVCGDEVAHGKPEPDIYLAAAKLLERDPGECLALEDSPPGVVSARKAGCITIMVPDLQAPNAVTRSMANFIYPSLGEVAKQWRLAREEAEN